MHNASLLDSAQPDMFESESALSQFFDRTDIGPWKQVFGGLPHLKKEEIPRDARPVIELCMPTGCEQEARLSLVLDMGRKGFCIISADYDGSWNDASGASCQFLRSFYGAHGLHPIIQGCLEAATRPMVGMLPDIAFWMHVFDEFRESLSKQILDELDDRMPLTEKPLYVGAANHHWIQGSDDTLLICESSITGRIIILRAEKRHHCDDAHGLKCQIADSIENMPLIDEDIKNAILRIKERMRRINN